MKLFLTNEEIDKIKNEAIRLAQLNPPTKSPSPEQKIKPYDELTRLDCDSQFDFYNPHLVPYLIERLDMNNGDIERTFISYYFAENLKPIPEGLEFVAPILREVNIYCSREEHNRLVKEFQEATRARFGTKESRKAVLKG